MHPRQSVGLLMLDVVLPQHPTTDNITLATGDYPTNELLLT